MATDRKWPTVAGRQQRLADGRRPKAEVGSGQASRRKTAVQRLLNGAQDARREVTEHLCVLVERPVRAHLATVNRSTQGCSR